MDAGARPLEHALGVVARRHGLDDRRVRTLRVQAGEEHCRLHLRGGHGKLVVDRRQPAALDDERRVAVRRLDPRAHAPQRLGDPLHRPRRERFVADELEAALLAREDAGQEPHERARVQAVDGFVGRAKPAQADPVDRERVDVLLDDLGAERAHSPDRCLGVGRAAKPGDVCRPVADRPDEDRAVRHGLVPGDGHMPFQGRHGLDAHPG